eukprot:Lankesteria_metandrocarpae@DN2112_c0_g1_i1.p1
MQCGTQRMLNFELQREKAASSELDEIQFESEPVKCTCPHCDDTIVSNVENQAGWLAFLVGFFVFLVLGWLALCVLPLVLPAVRDTIHYCPKCLNQIASSRRIKCPKISKEVFTVRCGSCAIVLSRQCTYFFTFLIVLIISANSFRWYLQNVGLPDIPRGDPSQVAWPEFLNDCGLKPSLGNPLHVSKAFYDKYYRRDITWVGRVNRIQEGIFTKNFIFLTMNPSQFVPSLGRSSPDVGLMFSKDFNARIADLEVEDEIAFEATLIELGRRGRPHLGILREFKVTAAKADLPPLHATRSLFGGEIGFGEMAREMSRFQPRVTFIRFKRMEPQPMHDGVKRSGGADTVDDGGDESMEELPLPLQMLMEMMNEQNDDLIGRGLHDMLNADDPGGFSDGDDSYESDDHDHDDHDHDDHDHDDHHNMHDEQEHDYNSGYRHRHHADGHVELPEIHQVRNEELDGNQPHQAAPPQHHQAAAAPPPHQAAPPPQHQAAAAPPPHQAAPPPQHQAAAAP